MQQTGLEQGASWWWSGQPTHYASQGPLLLDVDFQAYISVIIRVKAQNGSSMGRSEMARGK